MNFRRPCWLILFISLALIALGEGGIIVTPIVFRFLHIDNGKPPGPMDLVELTFLLLMGVGWFVAAITAIWCLFSAVFSLLRSKMKQS
jgi:hypothetical protein